MVTYFLIRNNNIRLDEETEENKDIEDVPLHGENTKDATTDKNDNETTTDNKNRMNLSGDQQSAVCMIL